MAKNILIIIFILLLLVVVYLVFFNRPPLNTTEVNIKGQSYNLEVAQTISQKSTGLMNRSTLCKNCGMLFIFGYEAPQAFWMKNTLIPLDMIFLDKNGKVINSVTAEIQAKNPDGSYKLFRSTAPAAYVIELNAGDAQKLNITPGDVIKL